MKTINLLTNSVQLDTQTSYQVNGDINVYVCPWIKDVEPLTEGEKRSYPARITVMENGDFTVKAFRLGKQGPRYHKRFATEHCEVMEAANGQLVERWKFPSHLSIHEVWAIRRREASKVNNFYRTLKDNQL